MGAPTKSDIQSSSPFREFLSLHLSDSEFALSYETLVNNLNSKLPSNKVNTILVTSSQPLEGKTTVATNLAISLTLIKKKVLIIDGDLRKPRLHQIFNVDNQAGFADLLSGRGTINQLIKHVHNGDMSPMGSLKLVVLPAGNANFNDLKLLGGNRTGQILNQLEKLDLDVIIVDAPPVLAVSDALTYAPLVEGIIMVVNSGIILEEDAKMAKKRIEQYDGNILGVVMNHFVEKYHGPSLNSFYSYYSDQSGPA